MRKASFLPFKIIHFLFELPPTASLALVAIGLMLAPEARSQSYLPGVPVDITTMVGSEINPSITIDQSNAANIFSVAVAEKAGAVNPLITSFSTNQGKTWFTNLIANGSDGLVPAYGYPSATFDSYGNLYVAYLPAAFEGVAIAISTNFGVSFTALTNLADADATETPRIAAGPATAPGSVWVVYKDYSQPATPLLAQGLQATNLGTNSQFGQPLTIPGSASGGFPDVAIGPAGQVLVAFQNNITNSSTAKIFVSLNTNAFGTNGFGPAITVTSDAIGGLTLIPAQSTGIGINANVGLAWNTDPFSAYYGRAYIIYTSLTGIGFRYSTENGSFWSGEETVNDDNSGNSHFMPRVAVDPVTGIVACSWYDCRNDQGNASQQIILMPTYSATFNDLYVTNVVVMTNNITNPTLSITTNTTDGVNYTVTVSGINLLGTLMSDNKSNTVYVSTSSGAFIDLTFDGNTGTNATGTNTGVTVTIVDTLADAFTTGSAANQEPMIYTAISGTGGVSFEPNQPAISTNIAINPNSPIKPPIFGFGSLEANSGSTLGFGNYTGLAFYSGDFYTAWADNSDITLHNPNGPLSGFDVTISDLMIPNADLTLFITNSPNPVLSDGVVAYSIEAINNGPSFTSCVVVDDLPPNVTFESAFPTVGGQDATYTINNQIFTLTIPPIAPRSSVTWEVLVTATHSGFGTNVALISGPLPDTVPSNNTNFLVTLFVGEDLAVSMSTSATNLDGGEFVTNVISVTNLGPSANGDVVISNLFTPNWGQLSVLSPGWNLAPNAITTGTYSTNNNVLVLNVGTLASNQFTNIVVSALALATTPSGVSLVSVSSLDYDPNPQNNSASASTTMTAETIGAGISAGPAQVGAPVTFTIIVTNFGPSPFGFITVSNTLPPNYGTISVIQSSNPATINANTILFPVGALATNGTATLIFTAIPQSLGTVTDSIVASCFDYAPSYTNRVLVTPTQPAAPIENFHVIPAASGAFLVWDTPINATVQVDYGLNVTYGSISSVGGPSTHHVVLLTGLERDTNYFFNALTWEGGALYVTNGTFSTIGTLILNTQDAVYSGLWTAGSSGNGIFGTYYQSAQTTVSQPMASATFAPMIPFAGNYDISIWYPQSPSFATNTPVYVSGATNEIFVSVNQAVNGGSWQPLAQDIFFAAGVTGNVEIENNTGVTNKGVAANGMRWIYDVTQDSPTNGSIPAWWTSFYFGTNNVSASADTDGDGYSNYAEYVFGTDPTNAASKLIFTVAPRAADMVTVNFSPYQAGRVYQLLFSTNLDNPQWLTLTNAATVDTNGNGVFMVTQPGQSADFYRLSATLSP